MRIIPHFYNSFNGDAMRNYQPTKNNPWQLDPAIYKIMLGVVRAYPGLKKDVDNEIYLPSYDFQFVGDGNSVRAVKCGLERKAIVMAVRAEKIAAVEVALEIVPEEYRRPILENIIKEKPYCSYMYASPRTLSRHKARFLYKLAYELDYI